ncbi:unnamed protein product [Spirodela intermedia]|uniref:C2H2-type domain-containing protein n=1 Tax=Spirodela intermedia TaxID=51605 RepID=A0A7I8L5B9_SPIIN|nr:unnamed protein product [Spirodela intermedia]
MAERRSSRKAHRREDHRKKPVKPPPPPPPPPPSWGAVWGILTCKRRHAEAGRARNRRIGCSGSLRKIKDASRVMHRPATPSPPARKKCFTGGGAGAGASGAVSSSHSSLSSSSLTTGPSSSSSSAGGSFRVLHLRRLSGCYECHTAGDPVNGAVRDSSLRTISPCPDCGEMFLKPESLELHQAARHAVMELGPDDTSRNIVEIIFQSSWMKKETPVCKIERILKVNNTKKTISRFEEYRDSVKTRAGKLPKKHPRCAADGNELLRFHCTSLVCTLGAGGRAGLCQAVPPCGVCSIIRDGFRAVGEEGIATMATSGRAHDAAHAPAGEAADGGARAMLVCRVIAGRVKKNQEASAEENDSIAGAAGAYSTMDELYVFNPRAILPCFVVIYGGF